MLDQFRRLPVAIDDPGIRSHRLPVLLDPIGLGTARRGVIGDDAIRSPHTHCERSRYPDREDLHPKGFNANRQTPSAALETGDGPTVVLVADAIAGQGAFDVHRVAGVAEVLDAEDDVRCLVVSNGRRRRGQTADQNRSPDHNNPRSRRCLLAALCRSQNDGPCVPAGSGWIVFCHARPGDQL